MMEAILPRSWKEAFERAATDRREETLYREKTKRLEARETEKQDEIRVEEERHDQETFAAFEAAIASEAAVIDYRHRLDDYDTATIEALMDRQETLDRLRKTIDRMEAEAHVLPDGRRVFKTQDGQRVVDENGRELSPEIIGAAEIDDEKTKWEPYKAATDEHARISEERQQLIHYQTKLDEARDRLDKGDITNGELDRMKADLSADMPEAVREKLGLEKPKTDAAAKHEASAAASPDDMDSLMKRTGFAPVAASP